MALHFKLSTHQAPKFEDEREYMKKLPYASAVGRLMYLMVCTRPDLAYTVSLVSIFKANPGDEHWKSVKWILRYLKGTTDTGLIFKDSRENDNLIAGYVDSDYAGSIDTRKSLNGYIFTINGTSVSWKSNLQPIVALSTTEAEYVTVTEAFKEAK
ncbi:secreted RxLR effector protein 161-like [Primulina tabacum]|uniref:secreted RxLR effector protein 161-like n=1 Tax=Primulina tabacum TaxID=48773 RepID=UPI003F5A1A09